MTGVQTGISHPTAPAHVKLQTQIEFNMQHSKLHAGKDLNSLDRSPNSS
jgi:hypothetical protein